MYKTIVQTGDTFVSIPVTGLSSSKLTCTGKVTWKTGRLGLLEARFTYKKGDLFLNRNWRCNFTTVWYLEILARRKREIKVSRPEIEVSANHAVRRF